VHSASVVGLEGGHALAAHWAGGRSADRSCGRGICWWQREQDEQLPRLFRVSFLSQQGPRAELGFGIRRGGAHGSTTHTSMEHGQVHGGGCRRLGCRRLPNVPWTIPDVMSPPSPDPYSPFPTDERAACRTLFFPSPRREPARLPRSNLVLNCVCICVLSCARGHNGDPGRTRLICF
jgi:hypothetical protein